MKVHHIGYLVKRIEKSIVAFEALGYKLVIHPAWDEGRQANLCFLRNGEYCVELIAPAEGSSLYPLLKQYKNAPYHMCYCCENLDEMIEELKKEKFMLFLEPSPAPVIGRSARVAFLMSSGGGMIELVEE